MVCAALLAAPGDYDGCQMQPHIYQRFLPLLSTGQSPDSPKLGEAQMGTGAPEGPSCSQLCAQKPPTIYQQSGRDPMLPLTLMRHRLGPRLAAVGWGVNFRLLL